MARVFSWTEDEGEIAPDAVTVGISSDTRMLTIAGLQFGQRQATMYWPDWPGRTEPLKAGLEGPMSVENALAKAEKLCSRFGFKRVVVWVQHRELWDNRWGSLAAQPGL